jgi:hypothetical protein
MKDLTVKLTVSKKELAMKTFVALDLHSLLTIEWA